VHRAEAILVFFCYTDMAGLAPEPYAYCSLRGLGELVPSTILLVGLATRPFYFVMASSANVPRLPLLGLLVLTRI
jgi:hypothetical protein